MRLDGPQGVGGANSVTTGYSVEKTETQEGQSSYQNSVNAYQVDNQGKGTAVQSNTDLNAYGKDIANFEKFKGNDKYDAMKFTSNAANDVKKAYMQLQHEFPDVNIQFEPMPDPKTFGKKREGFNAYQQELTAWKDIAMTQINNARSQSMQAGFKDVKDNDNRNAAMNATVTAAATGVLSAQIEGAKDAVLASNDAQTQQLEGDIKKGNATILKEVKATKKEVQDTKKEVQATKKEVQDTKKEVGTQADKTRKAVQEDGKETREAIQEAVDKLDPLHISQGIRRGRDAASEVVRGAGKAVDDIVDGIVRGGRRLFD